MSLPHLHFARIPSTMETAREEAGDREFLLVTAEIQTRGRGTRGRSWISPAGNLYLTLAAHRRFLSPARLGLFPLEAGLCLWESISEAMPLPYRSRLRLKWPNDLLWDARKAAGMLIESSPTHFLVGAGINLAVAPAIGDGGAPSASLAEAGLGSESALPLAKAFTARLQERLQSPPDPGLISAWKEKALWDQSFRLRDRPDQPQVFPLDVDGQGHLRVRFPDGREEVLVSEYLA